MISTGQPLIFDSPLLVPPTWQKELAAESWFVTNPCLLRFKNNWLMSYKVVSAGYAIERFAICRLDESLSLLPGSVSPLSDTIPDISTHTGDPRLFVFGDRLFVLYCHFRLPSLLYLAEVNADTLAACSPGRPLFLNDRQWQEKNWMLFEYEGECWAVYTIAPHVILKLDLDQPDAINCRRIYTTTWDVSAYARRFGQPRGGSLPVRNGDVFTVFFHSWQFSSRGHAVIAPLWQKLRASLGRPDHWQGPRLPEGDVRPLQPGTDWIYRPKKLPLRLDGLIRRYEQRFARRRCMAGCYSFSAAPPFQPAAISSAPLLQPEEEPPPQRPNDLLSTGSRVVFPCGAACLPDGNWLVSYGSNDESCIIRKMINVSYEMIPARLT